MKEQDHEKWFHQKCCLMVLEAILEEKMYDQLRTKEQLGYYVGAMILDTRGVQAMVYSVQSAEYSPVKLEERIFSFIRAFKEEILTEQMFNDYKKGLLSRRKKGFRDMNEESEYLFNNMKSYQMVDQLEIEWSRIDNEINYLENIITY